MNIKRFVTLFLVFLSMISRVSADEGMWIPVLLGQYNIRLMQEKGFRLTAEDIYSVNRACMKDAIVQFGGGCTGELISPDGLLITNHHCGYSLIQKHSTLEHDYLTNGFWAMSREMELPNKGLTVTFLRSMEDVTSKVLDGVTDDMDNSLREKTINANIKELAGKASGESGFDAVVKPFYMGRQYFLFLNETFRDVRLVGAPPSSIGKFGGETDNWVWPRHTGDFSLFRIYAGKDNKPADYSKNNIPYKPLYHFPVSLKGVKEGDFTMVFGYPGTTTEYLPSFYVEMIRNVFDPKMIEIRTKKIEIMEEAMNSDPGKRIGYSAKKAGLANSWKKWIGECQGLDRMGIIGRKKEFEKRIGDWIKADDRRKAAYGNVPGAYEQLYSELGKNYLLSSYTAEVFFNNGIEAAGFSRNIKSLTDLVATEYKDEQLQTARMNLLETAGGFFRNYDPETDKKLFISLMKLYGENTDPQWQIPEYASLSKEYNGNFELAARKIYSKSVFTDQARYEAFVKGFNKASMKKLNKDPLYLMAKSAGELLTEKIRPELTRLNSELQTLNRKYMAAQMAFDSTKIFYPDANSTLRVAYGNVRDYKSRDAVMFRYFSTLDGIIEKDNPSVYDYDVPDRLKELYHNKDFGSYAEDGKVHVCFIADNHTTGGNSGSPVINADGQLIGVNFDRAWEGVASDIAFNPEQSRNISLDIRYALFIIDKFAGAGYLLKEMTLVR